MSATQRSKALLEREGWTVAIVERWNPHARIRQDLFGFADLLAMKPGQLPLLVQVTSGSNVAARLTKIRNEPRAATALASGFGVQIHGWRKLKSNKGRWTPRIMDVEQCHITPSTEPPATRDCSP